MQEIKGIKSVLLKKKDPVNKHHWNGCIRCAYYFAGL